MQKWEVSKWLLSFAFYIGNPLIYLQWGLKRWETPCVVKLFQSNGILTSTSTTCWVQLQISYPSSSFSAIHKNIVHISWMGWRETPFTDSHRGHLVPANKVVIPTPCKPITEPRTCFKKKDKTCHDFTLNETSTANHKKYVFIYVLSKVSFIALQRLLSSSQDIKA